MKVLVVSDTHRRNDNFRRAVEKEAPVDMVIHCGDAEGEEDALALLSGCPMEIVLGNNDFFSNLSREREFVLEGHRIWITHGHNYYVSMGNETIKEEANARGAEIVIYGHTHRPVVDSRGNVLALNPGSLTYPRQEGKHPSYLIMNLEENKNPDCRICYL